MGKNRRRKPQSRSQKRKASKALNVKLVIYSILGGLILVFSIYSLFTIFGIRAEDPLSQNVSSHRFLSGLSGDLEKTIFILEQGEGEDSSITDVYVLLTNHSKGNSVVIYIPGYMYFRGLEEDFGSPIPISSLRYAGDFLQDGRGVEYSLWQLNEIFGFRSDNYIWMTSRATAIMSEVYGESGNVKEKYKEPYILSNGNSASDSFLRLHTLSSQYSSLKTFLNPTSLRGLDREIYSNLSFTSALSKLGSFQKVVNATTTVAMDLSSPGFSIDDLSDLGGQIRILNISEYDKVLRRYYVDIIDRDVEKERVRIEVYNGSNALGKAGIYARKVLNNGCEVVRFGNTPETLPRTQIYVSDEREFQNSVEMVSQVLFGRYEILEERPSFMTTGDIVILLGEDILQSEIF
jgi:hypothetical protein